MYVRKQNTHADLHIKAVSLFFALQGRARSFFNWFERQIVARRRKEFIDQLWYYFFYIMRIIGQQLKIYIFTVEYLIPSSRVFNVNAFDDAI